MRLFRPYFFSNCLYPEAIFRIKTDEKVVCLTFDDGPHPVSTTQIIEILGRHQVKALFFCKGEAAEKYPDLIHAITSGGHMIGNHGYKHLDGWATSLKTYLDNVTVAEPITSGKLFRPPYGRLRLNQYRNLKKSYTIFFWDIMSFDYDNSFGKESTYRILVRKIRPGSVIVLHDHPDTSAISILNEFIEFSLGAGYRFILPKLNDR